MLTYAILDYNRPQESELCLKSIHKFSKFNYNIVYLSNGGNQDYAIDFYKQGLIDKLILRKGNSGCGLGTRECFNDFNLDCRYIAYIQSDQFLYREFSQRELEGYLYLLYTNQFFYIDLAGNQGNGNPSERALIIDKYNYNKIPNSKGGPGPFANEKWTEQSFQEHMKENNLKFHSCPTLFLDNGKESKREYPCGGLLLMYTDTKQVFIVKDIKNRIDFPNIHLTDAEWSNILGNKWINGTVPELHKKDSFKYWERPYNIGDLK